MDRTTKNIVENYKLTIHHYLTRGIGNISGLFGSKVIITPKMIKCCLERYIELGGSDDFSDITEEKYEAWLADMNAEV